PGEELRDPDDGARLQSALQSALGSSLREVRADLLGQRPRARPRLARPDAARRIDRSIVPQLMLTSHSWLPFVPAKAGTQGHQARARCKRPLGSRLRGNERRVRLALTLAATMLAATTLAATPARAQDYPTRPVELIVPFAAGGGAELMARLLSEGLNTRLHQPFLVINRPGAKTNLGTI